MKTNVKNYSITNFNFQDQSQIELFFFFAGVSIIKSLHLPHSILQAV